MREANAACAPFPPLSQGANVSNPGKAAGRTLAKGAVFPARDRHPTLLFSAAASAQDLRALDVEKETREAAEVASPRGVLEADARLMDAEASSSSSSSGQHAMPSLSSHWWGFFRLWRPKSMRRLATFPPVGVPKLARWRTSREGKHAAPSNPVEADLSLFRPSWMSFSISELQDATDNFNSDNIIGKGGYAEVYKGCLADGQVVAVKKLTRGTPEERTSNFLSELGIIVHTNHPNVAKLFGFGVEGGMHIVLQLSPHGSLASFLYNSKEKLDWGIRYKVAVGTAKGLEYLHEKCQRRIIHRDIKAANILLADDFEPQICDFGLAKWLPDQWTHHTVSSFEGTFGYLAPEYSMHGIVDEKTDVYAFGVLLLELITGRQALDTSRQSLVLWAKPMLEKNDTRGLLDPSIGDTTDSTQLSRASYVASLCIQQSSILRPRMSQVLRLLKGEEHGPGQVKAGRLQRTFSEELFYAEEYNATRYLSDLNRHRKVALGS